MVNENHKFALVRYSDITGKHYIDRTFATAKSANKAHTALTQREHHSASYEVMPIETAKALV